MGCGRIEWQVVGPVAVPLAIAKPLLVPPQHLRPVVPAGLHAVFLDQVPHDLLKGDAPRWQVKAGEGTFELVILRRGKHVKVASRIGRRGISVVLVHEQWLRVVQIRASLVSKSRAQRLESRRAGLGGAVEAQGHLDV